MITFQKEVLQVLQIFIILKAVTLRFIINGGGVKINGGALRILKN